MWLQALTPVKAQNVVYQGETTTLEVIEVPGESYIWELYQDSTVDFAIVPGDCPPSHANFVSGNTGPSVQISWLEPGIYFYKITALNITGCTNNLTVGRIEVVEALPTATISPPDPDWLCVGESVFLEIVLTGTGPWDFTYTDGTQTQTISGITEPNYLLEVHPKAPTQYWITEVRNQHGVNDKPSAKVWLIVYPRPVSSQIYLAGTIPSVAQTYIDEVCTGAERRYRINGEPGSSYDWLLTYTSTNQQVPLTNPKGTAFSTTDPISGTDHTMGTGGRLQARSHPNLHIWLRHTSARRGGCLRPAHSSCRKSPFNLC
jgi:hypothetical protein